MEVRHWGLALGLLLGAAGAASGQAAGMAAARGSVRLTIQPVMQVDVASSRTAAPRADGAYYTAAHATRVRVSANFAWKLIAVRRVDTELLASSQPAATNAVPPLWVKVNTLDDRVTPVARDFADTSGGQVVVAEGEAGGDMEVAVDYRWLRDAGTGDSTADVSFVLMAR